MSPTDGTTLQRLTDLRNGLLRLHKTLLDSEREAYEHDVAPVTSPGHLLGLVMTDPWFAWLRELSQLVAAIDETVDSKKHPATPEDAARYIQQTRTLLVPAEGGQGFERRYYEAMQRDPDVILAHGAMMRVLSTLG